MIGWFIKVSKPKGKDGDGAIVGAIAAEPGMKQQNYVLWRNDECA